MMEEFNRKELEILMDLLEENDYNLRDKIVFWQEQKEKGNAEYFENLREVSRDVYGKIVSMWHKSINHEQN